VHRGTKLTTTMPKNASPSSMWQRKPKDLPGRLAPSGAGLDSTTVRVFYERFFGMIEGLRE
jgi:hypothetical protein